MREPRGALGIVGIVSVLTLVAAASPAFAAPGQADLVVRGLTTDGATSIVAPAGWLLLRDPGNEAFESVRLALPASAATVIVHRVSMQCFGERGLQTAGFALPVLADRRSALATPLDTVQQVVADPLATLGRATLVAEGATSLPLTRVLDETALVAHRVAPQAAPIPFVPGGFTPCMADPRPADTQETWDLTDFELTVTPTNGFYALLWEGSAQSDSPGSALFHGDQAEVHVQRSEETLRLLGAEDPYGEFDTAARPIPAGFLRTQAPAGRGALFGDGSLWVYNAVVQGTGQGADGEKTFEVKTGETTTRDITGQDQRVVTFVEIQATGASGSYDSPAPLQLFGERFDTNIDGVLRLKEARGTVRVGDESQELRGQSYDLVGAFGATLLPAENQREAQRGFLRLQTTGDLAPASAGPVDQSPVPVTTAAAAVSLAAIAAGAMAYFWPALKWMLAPLYTRIPTDALLMHDAREKIYKLIKQEPGIHAHEIAARLDLGWGTAVYHLKLLERNGLVVARHEGRYKRFFVTGDQRLQRKEAVSLLRNPTSRSIASQVATHPGLIQKQVCEALGLSPSLASWHLQRLEAAHVVRAERLGRAVRYIPGPAWTELQELDALLSPPPTAVAAPGAA